MLKSEAVEGRKWGKLRVLKEILGKKPTPERYFRPTSVHETIDEAERRFQDMLLLIMENEDELRGIQLESKEVLLQELSSIVREAEDYASWHRSEADRLRDIGFKMQEIIRIVERSD